MIKILALALLLVAGCGSPGFTDDWDYSKTINWGLMEGMTLNIKCQIPTSKVICLQNDNQATCHCEEMK